VYLAAIYLAKVWVGAFLGRMLLKPSGATKGDWMLGLLLGLLILTIVGFIPSLGSSRISAGWSAWVWFAWAWELLPASFIGVPDRY
jgi:hypothetical protein